MRNVTLVVSAALFALAVGYWISADSISESRLAGAVGADGFPKVLGVALGVLSLILAGQTLFESYIVPARDKAPVQEEAQDASSAWRGHLRAFGLIAIGIAYVLLLPYLGYMVAGGLMLGAVATYAGLRPSLATLLFAVCGGLCFYLIFVKLLQIPLPAGFWPGLVN
ncbi:tripartite tricarboxylate transporter TctB family protein [Albidovulum sediminis]|uniref:Tripartite tricarboxylate transporter TctB family protein n=1 Tax=Albidovulum sediminis TaxID=3066345 RepID=A0ABT2NRM2_9RHOB|nr:tripartite tricarboxylate transporter TctB family protein [Defluviimonas sediminis]MCT8331586.1 tripartite tricarboxylate transporter TctB family protein [Defluviimonas sediminis]